MGADHSRLATDSDGAWSWGITALGRGERLLWVAVGLTLLGDLVTTYYGLEHGLVESNPVARSAMGALGYAGLAVLKTLALGVAVSCRALVPSRFGPVVPASMSAVWGVAVVANAAVLLSA